MSKQHKDHATELFYGEGAVKLHMPLIVSARRTIGYDRPEPPQSQNMIAGVALTPEDSWLTNSEDDYELWVGDVILVPHVKLAGYDECGAMIGAVLCRSGWANKENWSKEIWRAKE